MNSVACRMASANEVLPSRMLVAFLRSAMMTFMPNALPILSMLRPKLISNCYQPSAGYSDITKRSVTHNTTITTGQYTSSPRISKPRSYYEITISKHQITFYRHTHTSVSSELTLGGLPNITGGRTCDHFSPSTVIWCIGRMRRVKADASAKACSLTASIAIRINQLLSHSLGAGRLTCVLSGHLTKRNTPRTNRFLVDMINPSTSGCKQLQLRHMFQ